MQVAHKAHLITIYLGPIPVLLTDHAHITQNLITRVEIATVIPGFLYNLRVIQADGALLRKDDYLWHVPYTAFIGGLNARRIKTALRCPPVRYRVLVGQDGIFRSPPMYNPTEPKHPKSVPKFIIESETTSRYYDQKPLTPEQANIYKPAQLMVTQAHGTVNLKPVKTTAASSPRLPQPKQKPNTTNKAKAKRPTSLALQ